MKISNVFVTIAGVAGVLLAAGIQQAHAWPPQVAPELEFTNDALTEAWEAQTNPDMIWNDTIDAVQKKFRDQVVSICPKCVISNQSDKYGLAIFRVTLEDGWYFNITMDPGVIEITSKPIPSFDLSDVAKRETMQKLIWDVAGQVGLHTDTAGHLNFGIESTFGSDALLFRNFFVDYLNHVGLIGGAAGYRDDLNAPHPELLEEGQRAALKSIFASFDPKTQTIQDLSKAVYEKVYFKSVHVETGGTEHAEKYHAVNVSSIVQGSPWPRLELRATTMQNSAEELELMAKLFTARIELLKKAASPIEYTAYKGFKNGKYVRSRVGLISDFHDYVVESGLKWEDYRVFALRNPKMSAALTKFESGLGLKERRPIERLREALSSSCK